MDGDWPTLDVTAVAPVLDEFVTLLAPGPDQAPSTTVLLAQVGAVLAGLSECPALPPEQSPADGQPWRGLRITDGERLAVWAWRVGQPPEVSLGVTSSFGRGADLTVEIGKQTWIFQQAPHAEPRQLFGPERVAGILTDSATDVLAQQAQDSLNVHTREVYQQWLEKQGLPASWVCPACGMVNDQREEVCSICREPTPTDAPPFFPGMIVELPELLRSPPAIPDVPSAIHDLFQPSAEEAQSPDYLQQWLDEVSSKTWDEVVEFTAHTVEHAVATTPCVACGRGIPHGADPCPVCGASQHAPGAPPRPSVLPR